jgi:sugar phosphate permease
MNLSKAQRRTFAVTWLTYAGFYFCRKNLSIALPLLGGSTGMDSLRLANIVFGYSLLYAIGQFVFGFLSDRIGPKRVVGVGLLMIVVSNLAMGFHSAILWLMIFACLNGAAQATGWSGLVKIMASWFSPENRGVVMAWWGTNYVLGGFLATAFATWSVSEGAPFPTLGGARGFLFPAILLLLLVPAFWAMVADTPRGQLTKTTAPDHHSDTSWNDVKALLQKPSLWTIGGAYFFLELCRYALMFWLPYYMVKELHYGLQSAGYLSGLYELVGVAGALFAGYISDRFTQSRRAPVAAIMLILLSLVMLFQPAFAHTGLVGMGIVISLAGFLSYGPDTLLSGAAAQDVGETRSAASASGLIDGIGHLGALASPYLVVLASGHYGWNQLFFIFAATALSAGLLLLPLWNLSPTHTNSKRAPSTGVSDLPGKCVSEIAN